MRINILTPTRGRPAGMRRVYDSIVETASSFFGLIVTWYVDDDDPASAAEAQRLSREGPIPSRLLVGNRVSQGPMQERLYDGAQRSEIYLLSSDDIVFCTPQWDTKVRAAFAQYPDRLVVVHGDDGVWRGRYAVNAFLSREWIETVGHVAPDYQFGYIDNHLTEVADRVKRRVYLPDVLIEHLHPRSHPNVPMDQTYWDRVPYQHTSRYEFFSARRMAERVADAEKINREIARQCTLASTPA